jgi:hypothetical protein
MTYAPKLNFGELRKKGYEIVHEPKGQAFMPQQQLDDSAVYFVKSFLESEFFGSNIAHIILGERVPEVKIMKDAKGALYVASKAVKDFQEIYKYFGQHFNYRLPEECIIGCVVDDKKGVYLQPHKPNFKGKLLNPPLEGLDEMVFVLAFVSHADKHNSNLGIIDANGVVRSAAVDFDSTSINPLSNGIFYAYHSSYHSAYNNYFYYNRDKLIQIIKVTLSKKEEIFGLVQDYALAFKYDGKNKIDTLSVAFGHLNEELYWLELAQAVEAKNTNSPLPLGWEKMLAPQVDKMPKISQQALDALVDVLIRYDDRELMAKLYPILEQHKYFNYIKAKAHIKYHKDYEAELEKIVITDVKLVHGLFTAAIQYDNFSAFNFLFGKMIPSFEEIGSDYLKIYGGKNVDLYNQLSDVLEEAIIFNNEKAFNVVFDLISGSDKYVSSGKLEYWLNCFLNRAITYNRESFFEKIASYAITKELAPFDAFFKFYGEKQNLLINPAYLDGHELLYFKKYISLVEKSLDSTSENYQSIFFKLAFYHIEEHRIQPLLFDALIPSIMKLNTEKFAQICMQAEYYHRDLYKQICIKPKVAELITETTGELNEKMTTPIEHQEL